MSRHGEFNGTEKSSLDNQIRLSWLGHRHEEIVGRVLGVVEVGGRILGKRKRSIQPRMTFIEQACRDV